MLQPGCWGGRRGKRPEAKLEVAVEEKGLIYSKGMPAKGHSPPIPGGHSLDCVEHGEGQGKDRC